MNSLPQSVDWRLELEHLVLSHSSDVMAGKSTDEMMRPVIDLAIHKFGCCLVHVWSVDPRREKLVLVAQGYRQIVTSPIVDVIDAANSYTGIAFETRQPQVHRDLNGIGDRKFCNEPLRSELGLKSFVSLPVRNLSNPHQVTLIVNLYCDFMLPVVMADRRFATEFRRYAALLASSFENNLRERSFRMSARVSQALGRVNRLTPESGCTAFAHAVREALEADWVTVFLENWNATALVRQADSRIVGSTEIRPESPIPEVVMSVYRTNRELLAPNMADEPGDTDFVEANDTRIVSTFLVPLHDVRGRCKGVVRCVNFARSGSAAWRRRHSYDDIAIVESMERAFAPPLDMLLESQARDDSLSNLAHELRVQIVALRAVHERMEREYNDGKDWFTFRYPYFNEVHTFTGVMQRLLRQLEIARIGPEKIQLRKQKTRLLADVIQPAIRFMEPLLRQRGMKINQIRHQGFEDVPAIDVDRGLLTQLVFNLLDNMAKYFPKSRSNADFFGLVECSKLHGWVQIAFTDNGDGVSKDDQDRIFEHGFRSAEAEQSHVQGTGLGCWLAREIAYRHGGSLVVTSAAPFKLTLKLPHPRLRSISGL